MYSLCSFDIAVEDPVVTDGPLLTGAKRLRNTTSRASIQQWTAVGFSPQATRLAQTAANCSDISQWDVTNYTNAVLKYPRRLIPDKENETPVSGHEPGR